MFKLPRPEVLLASCKTLCIVVSVVLSTAFAIKEPSARKYYIPLTQAIVTVYGAKPKNDKEDENKTNLKK